VKTPWQSHAVPVRMVFWVWACWKSARSSVVFMAPIPGAMLWLMSIMAFGAAYVMRLVMVQGFLVPLVGQVWGMGHFSLQW
jgi:hypothetical protein